MLCLNLFCKHAAFYEGFYVRLDWMNPSRLVNGVDEDFKQDAVPCSCMWVDQTEADTEKESQTELYGNAQPVGGLKVMVLMIVMVMMMTMKKKVVVVVMILVKITVVLLMMMMVVVVVVVMLMMTMMMMKMKS